MVRPEKHFAFPCSRILGVVQWRNVVLVGWRVVWSELHAGITHMCEPSSSSMWPARRCLCEFRVMMSVLDGCEMEVCWLETDVLVAAATAEDLLCCWKEGFLHSHYNLKSRTWQEWAVDG